MCILLFTRDTFVLIYSFPLYVFCLLVVLVKLSVLAKWLARKTRPRKPNRGKGIISTEPRPKNVYDFLGLVYCFIVLLYVCIVPGPMWYISYSYGMIYPICAAIAIKHQPTVWIWADCLIVSWDEWYLTLFFKYRIKYHGSSENVHAVVTKCT